MTLACEVRDGFGWRVTRTFKEEDVRTETSESDAVVYDGADKSTERGSDGCGGGITVRGSQDERRRICWLVGRGIQRGKLHTS